MARSRRMILASGLLVGTAFAGLAQAQDVVAQPGASSSLETGFRAPPATARPRVWWHWLNGNVSVEGIDKDLDWLADIGIGGVQNFDANLSTPQIVDKRLVYMDPAWKAAFRHAVERAQARGLEFTIAASPGWSETGGPWVPPQDAMKKLTWSETVVPGGRPVRAAIPPPPDVTGPYQTIRVQEVLSDAGKVAALPRHGGDIAVLAVPIAASSTLAPVAAQLPAGTPVRLASLTDADPESSVTIPGLAKAGATSVDLVLAGASTVRSARVFVKDAQPPFAPPRFAAKLQAEVDGAWRDVAPVPLSGTPTTVSFAPVSATHFRLEISAGMRVTGGGLGSVPGAVITELFPASPRDGIEVGEFSLFGEGRVEQVEAKAGFATVANYYAIDTASPATGPALSQVIDLTSRLRADGTLDWLAPKGNDWRILRLGWSLTGTTNHPATDEATGLEVDKYDAAAVERYLDTYLAMYRGVVGAENIGAKGIRGLLTDSTEVGASNWTPRLLAEFRTRRGYDALPWLPVLTGTVIGTSAQSDRFLYDYRRTLGELMAQAHYGTVARVAHANGLKVYGEALEDGRPVLGNDLAMRRYADVPMSALWTFPKGGQARPGLLGDMKGAASVAHFYGQNLVAAESMTSAYSPWAFAPSDLKHVVDLEFAQGVNLPVIHTSVHQPEDTRLPGLSLAIFGQYFNRHETWAGMARPWVDYLSRTAYLLQQGRYAADVAVFYGEESPVTSLFRSGPPGWLPQDRGYDLVNADMVQALTVGTEGALVSPGGMRYRVLYLAGTSDRLSVPSLRALKRLVEGGARLIGVRPKSSPSQADDPAEFAALADAIWSSPNAIATSDLEAGLKRVGIGPDFEVVGSDRPDIRFVHRHSDDADIYFVSNRETRPVTTSVRLRVSGKTPELWRAIGGTVEPVGYDDDGETTTVPLELAAGDSVFLVFRRPSLVRHSTVPSAQWTDAGTLGASWQVRFEAGRGAPESLTMNALAPLDRSTEPGVRYFSGTATYTTTVAAPRRTKGDVWLDLGTVGDVAEVRVNGRVAGTVWFAPYRLDVGRLLKSGKNRIEVRVANLWVNRLIGDQQPGAKPITWTAVPTYHADAPLRPSGLIGPVRFLVRR